MKPAIQRILNASRAASRHDDFQRRREGGEVRPVAGDDALEAQGEGGDEDVGDQTFGGKTGAAALRVVVPKEVRRPGINVQPRLGESHMNMSQLGLLLPEVTLKGYRHFNEGYGRDQKSLRFESVQTSLGRGSKHRIFHADIQKHRGVNNPSHSVLLPFAKDAHDFRSGSMNWARKPLIRPPDSLGVFLKSLGTLRRGQRRFLHLHDHPHLPARGHGERRVEFEMPGVRGARCRFEDGCHGATLSAARFPGKRSFPHQTIRRQLNQSLTYD